MSARIAVSYTHLDVYKRQALDNSVVTMDGIDIRNNSAVYRGGAVYLEGNVSGVNTAKFIMKSGSITGNSAGEGFDGGGISAWSGAEIEISGGTIENLSLIHI